MLQQTGHWSLQCILVLIEAVCKCDGSLTFVAAAVAGCVCRLQVDYALSVCTLCPCCLFLQYRSCFASVTCFMKEH